MKFASLTLAIHVSSAASLQSLLHSDSPSLEIDVFQRSPSISPRRIPKARPAVNAASKGSPLTVSKSRRTCSEVGGLTSLRSTGGMGQ